MFATDTLSACAEMETGPPGADAGQHSGGDSHGRTRTRLKPCPRHAEGEKIANCGRRA